jgi:hypothetical protein
MNKFKKIKVLIIGLAVIIPTLTTGILWITDPDMRYHGAITLEIKGMNKTDYEGLEVRITCLDWHDEDGDGYADYGDICGEYSDRISNSNVTFYNINEGQYRIEIHVESLKQGYDNYFTGFQYTKWCVYSTRVVNGEITETSIDLDRPYNLWGVCGDFSY